MTIGFAVREPGKPVRKMFFRWLDKYKPRFRKEKFGWIGSLSEPPLLVYLDRPFHNRDRVGKPRHRELSAPVEVHLALTRRCSMGCDHCYMSSSPLPSRELDTVQMKEVIRTLGSMGVFHLALGGGESTERDDLFELADYIRSQGMTPNLITNGITIDHSNAIRFRVFGRVNVSLDGLEDEYATTRGVDRYREAVRGIRALVSAGVSTGINCVVTRNNFERIESLVRFAKRERLTDVELLRFKPTGRGKDRYADHRLEPKQVEDFFSTITRFSRECRLPIKADCSFVPAIAWHDPGVEVMDFFGVNGCEAGNELIAIHPDGAVSACSFWQRSACDVSELRETWDTLPEWREFRDWDRDPPPPCSDCKYLEICKGGCRAVTLALTGRSDLPDPECPRVIRWREGL